MSADTATVLLAAVRLTRGRFKGRAALERMAEGGDFAALDELCERLGIPLPEQHWGRNELWRWAHAPVRLSREEHLAALTTSSYTAADDYHAIRRLRRARHADRVGVPAPAEVGRIARLARERREERERARVLPLLVAARNAAGLRTATHVHEDNVQVLPAGETPRATSVSDTVWSSDAGMSNAYCKKAFRVATSRHVWALPYGCEPVARGGYVYLSESVRVRSGRGTSLVVEHLTASRARGRLVWVVSS